MTRTHRFVIQLVLYPHKVNSRNEDGTNESLVAIGCNLLSVNSHPYSVTLDKRGDVIGEDFIIYADG